jgi:hypothetical protein
VGWLDDNAGLAVAVVGAVALLAAVATLLLWLVVVRMRRAQRVVLGASRAEDLVAYAARTDAHVTDLEEQVARLLERINRVDRRVHGALINRAIVRYDAFAEGGGLQSSSTALLDGNGTGIVLSAVVNRESDRLYVRDVTEGRGELPLSPEEAEAVRLAMRPD